MTRELPTIRLWKEAYEPDVIFDNDGMGEEYERSGFIAVERHKLWAEQNNLLSFSEFLEIGKERLNKTMDSVTNADEFAAKELKHGGDHMGYFLKAVYSAGIVKYASLLVLGAVEVRIVLPEAITSKDMSFEDINEINDAMKEMAEIRGEQGRLIDLDLIKARLDTKWKGFSDWFEEQAESLYENESMQQLDFLEAERALLDYRVGGYIYAFGVFLRTEKEGFEKYHT